MRQVRFLASAVWWLLLSVLFGRCLQGLDVCARALGRWTLASRGACAYCGQHRKLVEVPGPLGTGGVLVCEPGAPACSACVR